MRGLTNPLSNALISSLRLNHSRMIDRIKITETMIMAEFEELLLTSPENFSESTKGTAKIAAELIKDIVNITQNLNLRVLGF